MKSLFSAALLCCILSSSFAQKQSDPLPYNKEQLDSLFKNLPKSNQPFVFPSPKGYTLPENMNSFEMVNPGATVINKTTRGTIYNMPLDNMAVLVPDMNTVENMPGSSRNYKPVPQSNMPNPLQPQMYNKKKKN